jgi:hypothetical protein
VFKFHEIDCSGPGPGRREPGRSHRDAGEPEPASDSVLARRGLSIGTQLQLEVVQFASRKRRVNQRE